MTEIICVHFLYNNTILGVMYFQDERTAEITVTKLMKLITVPITGEIDCEVTKVTPLTPGEDVTEELKEVAQDIDDAILKMITGCRN